MKTIGTTSRPHSAGIPASSRNPAVGSAEDGAPLWTETRHDGIWAVTVYSFPSFGGADVHLEDVAGAALAMIQARFPRCSVT